MAKRIVADRKLAAGEDRTRRDAELVRAGFALEELAGLVGVDQRNRSAGRPARRRLRPNGPA